MESELLEYLTGFISEARLRRFDEVLAARTRHVTVVLEDFFQTQNASACLRSCECFGLQDVHVIERRNTFESHPDIALGATRWLTVHRHNVEGNSDACLKQLREDGFRIVATTPAPGRSAPEDLKITEPFALLFGTEKDGLTEAAIAAADDRIHIPMVGFTGSLNVSVSLGILVQTLTQRVRNELTNWQLSAAERQQLREAWVLKTLGGKAEPLIRRFRSAR